MPNHEIIFDDLMGLSAEDLQTLIRNTDPKTLLTAMAGVPEELRYAILAEITNAIPKDRLYEWDALMPLGRLSIDSIESAQKSIITLASTLELTFKREDNG